MTCHLIPRPPEVVLSSEATGMSAWVDLELLLVTTLEPSQEYETRGWVGGTRVVPGGTGDRVWSGRTRQWPMTLSTGTLW